MKLHKLVLLECLVFTAMSSHADDVGQSYFILQPGYLWTDHDRQRDNNWYGALGAGANLAPNLALEFNLGRTRIDAKNNAGPALDLTSLSLDALFYAGRDRIAPYLLVGAGLITDSPQPSGDSKRSFMGEAGLGVRALLWENSDQTRSFSLRPEVKARYDDIRGGDYIDYIASLGFQFGFGPKPVAVAAAPATPPPPPPPAEPPPPPPPPAPMDSDHDGVTDDRDRCPDSAPGVMVDVNGCEQKGSVTLEGVTFEFNSSMLTSASQQVLNTTAQGMKTHPRVRIELQGHTDSKGADNYNLKLSQRRAEAVRDYLQSQGVNAAQLSARGYGESQPVADNTTEAGRAKNRRVVMNVLENPRDIPVVGSGTAEDTASH